MNISQEALDASLKNETRRHFLKTCSTGMGMMALGSLLSCDADKKTEISNPYLPKMPHFLPKAKSVIYLHMAGSPSQLELFDFKPELQKYNGKDCPAELLAGKTFAFIQIGRAHV